MLQQDGRGQRVHIGLTTSGRATLLAYGIQGTCGAHALIPELERETGTTLDGCGHLPGGAGLLTFLTLEREGKTHQDSNRLVNGGELEKPRHREPLSLSALQRFERRGEHLGFIAESEADPELAPVDGEDAALRRYHPGKVRGEK